MPGDCPDEHSLQRFLLGRSSNEEANDFEQHLEECELCLAVLKRLNAIDGMIESLQHRSDVDEVVSSEWVSILTDWLKRMSPPLGAGPPLTSDPPGSAETPNSVVLSAGECTLTYTSDAARASSATLTRLGPYEIRKVLGSGGMGIVFQAFDPHLERLVALKTMLPSLSVNPQAKERFLREARVAAAIKHDHVVTIYHVGEDSGIGFLAMELLEGESLASRLNREGRLPLRDVLRIACETGIGLASAHSNGSIHRDIKPGNIWLESIRTSSARSLESESASTGPNSVVQRVKILDFGLALQTSADTNQAHRSGIQGTPAYIPPEQFRESPVDARADLFSLGCVIYQMATGQPPFKGGTHTISTLIAVATSRPLSPRELNPELPPRLCKLIERLLEKDPDARPPSAAAVVEELRTIEREFSRPPDGTQNASAGKRQFRYRRPRKFAVLAAILVCTLAATGYWIWRRPDEDSTTRSGRIAADPKVPPEVAEFEVKSRSSDGLQGLYADRAYAIEGVQDFRDIVAATSEELRTWKDGLDAKFRISSVSSRIGTGAVQFNAVALQEENPHEYHLLVELDDEAAKKTFDRLHHEEGFRLVGSCGTLKDGQELPWRSTQLWVKDGQTQKHWYGWMETIVEGNVEGKSTNFRPTYMAGRASPEGLGCNSVLAPDQGRAWSAFYSLDSNELLGTIEFYRRKGWRPDIVSPYWENDRLQYMLIVLENSDGVDWRFRMDMTINDYKSESAEQRKLGLFPHSLTSHGEGVNTRYEALFVRFRKRSKE